MEKLILLGTGNANATKCYNTCMAIQNEKGFFLVDAGGGNGILIQLEKAGIPLTKIHEIFLSHAHTDHLLGMVWIIRMIAAKMRQGTYEGKLDFYCHKELTKTLMTIVNLTLQEKFVKLIGDRILLHPIKDGEERKILDRPVQFFDIRSSKEKQYGFAMELSGGKRLAFIGDEPYKECERKYVQGADWLLHEAFCLHSQAERFQPYEKHHTTVLDACRTGQELQVKNLVLYHTEDVNIERRKELYLAEGRPYFSGNLYVPEDLEEFALS